jgi:hypothetical protein
VFDRGGGLDGARAGRRGPARVPARLVTRGAGRERFASRRV